MHGKVALYLTRRTRKWFKFAGAKLFIPLASNVFLAETVAHYTCTVIVTDYLIRTVRYHLAAIR